MYKALVSIASTTESINKTELTGKANLTYISFLTQKLIFNKKIKNMIITLNIKLLEENIGECIHKVKIGSFYTNYKKTRRNCCFVLNFKFLNVH